MVVHIWEGDKRYYFFSYSFLAMLAFGRYGVYTLLAWIVSPLLIYEENSNMRYLRMLLHTLKQKFMPHLTFHFWSKIFVLFLMMMR